MAGWGKCDFRELEEFRDKMERLAEEEMQSFCKECAGELAGRLLRKVIKRTPVGDYEGTYDVEDDGEKKFLVMSDKQGGTLRKNWSIGSITKEGNDYVVDVINPTNYAPYVEYGHRQTPGRYVPAIGKKLKKGWVNGHFMLTISEKEIKKATPGILEKKLKEKLEETFR